MSESDFASKLRLAMGRLITQSAPVVAVEESVIRPARRWTPQMTAVIDAAQERTLRLLQDASDRIKRTELYVSSRRQPQATEEMIIAARMANSNLPCNAPYGSSCERYDREH